MGAIASLRAGLGEVFLLRDAQRKVEAYGPERLAAVRAERSRARSLLWASRRLADPAAATDLLEKSLEAARAALHEAGNEEPPLAVAETYGAMPDFAAAETRRDELEARVVAILRSLEARSPLEIRALRAGRVGALALAFVAVFWPIVRDRYLVHDVALGKPVLTSPLKVNPPSGAELVDGHTHGTFSVHTLDGHPFVTIDLERDYHVRSVRVYNRGDGWFDDVLPLTLSTSMDGVHWEIVATRTTHFDVWDQSLGGRDARFVRLSKDSGYIALNAIEVFARN